MAEKKYQKKSKKKSRRNLYDMVIFRIFAPVLYHNRQQKYEFLNISIHMLEETIIRDKQLEDKFVSALTEYIKQNAPSVGSILKESLTNIKSVWESFFEVAYNNPHNYKDICDFMNQFYTDAGFNFSNQPINISILECYLKSIIHFIDPYYVFNDKKNYTCLEDLGCRIEYLCKTRRDKKGRFIYKDKSFGGATALINDAIDARNGKVHVGGGSIAEDVIKAFYCASLIFGYVKDICLVCTIKINKDRGDYALVKIKIGDKIINSGPIKWKEYIFTLSKDDFKDNSGKANILIEIQISGNNQIKETIKETITRGRLNISFGPYPPRKQSKTTNELSRNGKEEKKKIAIDNPKQSHGETYQANSTNKDVSASINDLSKLRKVFQKLYKCKKCGDSVAKESYDDHTQLCSKCHGEFRKHYDEGDSECDVYKKTLEKDCLREAIEEYQKAKEYAYGETAENIESKIGQCHFYLEEYSKAFNAFIKSDSIADSLYYLGLCYEKGYGTRADSSEAMNYYTKAARQDQALAQYTLGIKYYYGEYIKQDHKLAFDCFQKASKQNVVDAKYMLGLMYKNGEGVNRDENLAYLCFLEATNGKHLKAQYEMATYLLEGRDFLKKDVDNAFSWYKNAAEQGLPEAMMKVAQLYRRYSNYEPAIEWYRKALDLNVLNAKEQLIATLLKRAELAHDMDEEEMELKLLLEAADLGDNSCYHKIADVYHYGTDKIKDQNKAKEWYSKALSNGDYSTYIPIGDIYFSHNNLNMAEDYYRKAIAEGFIEGKKGLARLLNEKGDRILGNTYASSVSTYFDSEIANIILKK